MASTAVWSFVLAAAAAMVLLLVAAPPLPVLFPVPVYEFQLTVVFALVEPTDLSPPTKSTHTHTPYE